MKIGEAATVSGASPRALRLYEHEGLILPGRCSNGYRDYCASTIEQVRAIRSLMEAGLPVRLIKKVLPSLLGGSGRLDARARAEIADYHDQLAHRIAQLEHRRAALSDFLTRIADAEPSSA